MRLRGPRGVLVEEIQLDGKPTLRVTQHGAIIGYFTGVVEAVKAVKARGIDPADLEPDEPG